MEKIESLNILYEIIVLLSLTKGDTVVVLVVSVSLPSAIHVKTMSQPVRHLAS